jgi:hypothetical protein
MRQLTKKVYAFLKKAIADDNNQKFYLFTAFAFFLLSVFFVAYESQSRMNKDLFMTNEVTTYQLGEANQMKNVKLPEIAWLASEVTESKTKELYAYGVKALSITTKIGEPIQWKYSFERHIWDEVGGNSVVYNEDGSITTHFNITELQVN